jgi:spoIIIJ-associated protein
MPHILVDSEGYRTRHIENLVSLALRLSEKAKKKGGTVSTPPLNAADRRTIHMTLKQDADLTTWSKGDGGIRKVIIAPRQ